MATVRVRVAVVVDPSGDWNACGWSSAKTDADMMGIAADTIGHGEARYFLTADLEIPRAADVAASVSA